MDHDSRRRRRSGGGRLRGLRVSVSDGRGRPVADGGLGRWLSAVCPARVDGEVAVALVTDAHIHKLNSHYRHKNAPTDVLSFPADPIPDGGSRPVRFLGDIVIARGVARRQGQDAGHSYQAELRVLALHGLLHLLGYDHDSAADHGRMARVERRLRRRGGLRAGLIERS